jgi:hypothetical protein
LGGSNDLYYYWGLPLVQGVNSLIALPEYVLERPTNIDTQVHIISEDLAEFTMVWTAFGSKADGYRQYVEHMGLANLSAEALDGLQKRYGNVLLHSPMTVMDDRENNIFTLTESYYLPLRKRGSKCFLNLSSIVVQNFLTTDFNPNRFTPYSLIYPLWVKEHIHIDSPISKWKSDEDENSYIGSSVSYHFHSKMESQEADFYYELKHLDDAIPAEEVQEYWEAAQEIESYGSIDFKIK